MLLSCSLCDQSQEELEKRQRQRLAELAAKDEEAQRTSLLTHQVEGKVSKRVARWARASGRSLVHMLRTLPALFKEEGLPEGIAHTVEALGAGPEDAKKAYLRVIRVLHPDKVQASASLQQRVLARCVFAALAEAYQAQVEAAAGPPSQPVEPPGTGAPTGAHHQAHQASATAHGHGHGHAHAHVYTRAEARGSSSGGGGGGGGSVGAASSTSSAHSRRSSYSSLHTRR